MTDSNQPALNILLATADTAFVGVFEAQVKRLISWSVHLVHVADGQSALERLQKDPFSLLFLDYALPDINGLEVIQCIGQTSLRLPIIMLISQSEEPLAADAIKRGIFDYILKKEIASVNLNTVVQRALSVQHLLNEKKHLEELQNMKDEFLAAISHELRTPLTIILGHGELMTMERGDGLSSKQRVSVQNILTNTRHLIHLLNNLFEVRDFAKSVRFWHRENFSFLELIKKQVDAFRPMWTRKNIGFESSMGDDPLWMYGSPRRLEEVLENLLHNAVKFTPINGHIKLNVIREADNHIQLDIIDDGDGIPSESLPNIFNRFYQADQSLTRNYTGLGLGLSICKQIVEAHGGRIWAFSSGHRQGTRISFRLPILPQPTAITEVVATPIEKTFADKLVLLVDDDQETVRLMQDLLTGLLPHAQIRSVMSGKEALSFVQSRMPDLITLDIMMPDMNGIEILDAIRRMPQGRHVPILVVSAYPESIGVALEHGASGVCPKPFHIEELLSQMEKLVKH
ncbi:MAG TPA: hybrid sensor histidine kinase/response regulator [Elusimicrobiota bacterium]|nr:hybrid sensor histidine kinase/response regulator [Elusimicrobiota bacterium]